MKKLFFLSCLLLTACGAQATAQAQAARVAAAPASTAIPSALPNFQATIQVAQSAAEQSQQDAYNAQQAAIDSKQTAVAANVAIVGYTAAYEANQMEYARMTQVLDMGTATAAATAIPGTQTANANLLTANAAELTANAEQRQLVIAGMTATHAAPTQMVAQARAQNEVWAAPWISLGTGAALFGLAIFLIGVGVFAYRFNGKLKTEPVPTVEEPEPFAEYTPVAIKVEDDSFSSVDYSLIPCAPDQLTELANGLLNEHKTLALRHWEGSATTFKRDVIYAVRQFLSANKMALSAGRGDMVLTAKGEGFFRAWLENGTPPPSYAFAPNIETNGWTGALTGENLIQENGGGVPEGIGEVAYDA